MSDAQFKNLADKVNKLIDRADQLEADNIALRELQDDLQKERARLLKKNDLAKNKIEAMIGRLKALEQK